MSKADKLKKIAEYMHSKGPLVGFFSTLDELAQQAPFEKGDAQQWLGYLKPGRKLVREGVEFPLKLEEINYSKLPDLVKLPGAITKDQVLDHIRTNRPAVNLLEKRTGSRHMVRKDQLNDLVRTITELGRSPEQVDDFIRQGFAPERFDVPDAYMDPDLPESARKAWNLRTTEQLGDNWTAEVPAFTAHTPDYAEYGLQTPDYDNYMESVTRMPDLGPHDDHFGKNSVSWSRVTTHKTPENKTLRLIDEIQSDRHSDAAQKNKPRQIRLEQLPHLGDDVYDLMGRVYPNEYRPMGITIQGKESAEKVAKDIEEWSKGRAGYHTAEEAKRSAQLLADFKDRQEIGKSLGKVYTLHPDDAERAWLNWKVPNSVPDAPFKDPRDYGGLELRKQMLMAAREGDDYLGIVDPDSLINRYGMNEIGRQAEGQRKMYGETYPSELQKLARQYGLEYGDVPGVQSNSRRLNSLHDVVTGDGVEYTDPGDYIDRSINDIWNNDLWLDDDRADSLDHERVMVQEIMANARSMSNEMKQWAVDNIEHPGSNELLNKLRRADQHHEFVIQRLNNLDFGDNSPEPLVYDTISNDRDLHNYIYLMTKAYDDWQSMSKTKGGTGRGLVLDEAAREKIRRIGVPLWSLAGLSALAPADDESAAEGFGDGGRVGGLKRLLKRFGDKYEQSERGALNGGLYGENTPKYKRWLIDNNWNPPVTEREFTALEDNAHGSWDSHHFEDILNELYSKYALHWPDRHYRGLEVSKKDVPRIDDLFPDGPIALPTRSPMVPTSADYNMSKSFSELQGDSKWRRARGMEPEFHNVMLEILPSKNNYVLPQVLSGQDEMLVPRDAKFKVLDYWPEDKYGDQHHYVLERLTKKYGGLV